MQIITLKKFPRLLGERIMMTECVVNNVVMHQSIIFA